jgi:hypothetical protein
MRREVGDVAAIHSTLRTLGLRAISRQGGLTASTAASEFEGSTRSGRREDLTVPRRERLWRKKAWRFASKCRRAPGVAKSRDDLCRERLWRKKAWRFASECRRAPGVAKSRDAARKSACATRAARQRFQWVAGSFLESRDAARKSASLARGSSAEGAVCFAPDDRLPHQVPGESRRRRRSACATSAGDAASCARPGAS